MSVWNANQRQKALTIHQKNSGHTHTYVVLYEQYNIENIDYLFTFLMTLINFFKLNKQLLSDHDDKTGFIISYQTKTDTQLVENHHLGIWLFCFLFFFFHFWHYWGLNSGQTLYNLSLLPILL
jgi:hypothetical protein